MKELAQEHPRWGYRFLHTLVRHQADCINHKRVLRLYRAEGLKLRAKRRKKVVSVQRVKPPETKDINQEWTGCPLGGDFVSDTLKCGRRLRALNVIDCHSRECLAMEVDTSLSGEREVRVLETLRETRGLPQTIQTDNGPEFTGHQLDIWAYRNRVRLFFVEPGKPVQNGHLPKGRPSPSTANCATSARTWNGSPASTKPGRFWNSGAFNTTRSGRTPA